jgi:hypothetical protein
MEKIVTIKGMEHVKHLLKELDVIIAGSRFIGWLKELTD